MNTTVLAIKSIKTIWRLDQLINPTPIVKKDEKKTNGFSQGVHDYKNIKTIQKTLKLIIVFHKL